MKTGYTLFKTDGTATRQSCEWPARPGLNRIKEMVEPLLGGGGLMHMSVLLDGKERDMFVDDATTEGFEVNEQATKIWHTTYLTRFPKADSKTLPWVYGPAVLFDRQVWF